MEEKNEIYPKLFTWLFVGLLITFVSGYVLAMNPELTVKVLGIGFIPIAIIELVIALVMGIRIRKMHPFTMKICYLLFSITTGITFSTIFLTYELTSLLSIFIITAAIFALLALYGYKTKKDLSKFGVILFFSLLGTLIGSLLNFFIFKSALTDIVISGLGILIFSGYIAFDMNRVKGMLIELGEEKTAIYGAFQLYLDFINLFIRLLELFGQEKRD